MSMNVKSPSPPFIFFIKKCDPPPESSKIYSYPPLCCVKFMLTLPFWAGKKLMTHPPSKKTNAPFLEFLKNDLGFEDPAKKFELQRVHRLGKPVSGKNTTDYYKISALSGSQEGIRELKQTRRRRKRERHLKM